MDFIEHITRREPVPKSYRQGTNRCCTPTETVARVTPFLNAMGITRVANVTGLDHIGIPVVMVCRPNSRSLSVSQGKGLELQDARASGLMECIELYHAEHIARPRLFESYARLRRRARVANVNELPRTSGSRFHANFRIFWIEGYDLLNHEPVWLPDELVNVDFRVPGPKGAGCFLHTSSGLAAGNDFLEALIHGICEVIEEDCGSLWKLLDEEQGDRTTVRLETVDDPACRRVLDTYQKAGLQVAAWSATTDVGVPAFFCTIIPESDDAFRPLYAYGGYGCHPSRNIALLRALLEAAQSRLTVIAGARDDFPRREHIHHSNRRKLKALRADFKKTACQLDFHALPTFDGATLNEDLEWLLGRLRRAGIRQVLAVDLSQPAMGIPVVRIVIPRLEGLSDSSRYVRGPRAKARLAGRL